MTSFWPRSWSSSPLVRKWFRLLALVVVVPYSMTYLHLYNLFSVHNCRVDVVVLANGFEGGRIECPGRTGPVPVLTTTVPTIPPSIVQFTVKLAAGFREFKTRIPYDNSRRRRRRLVAGDNNMASSTDTTTTTTTTTTLDYSEPFFAWSSSLFRPYTNARPETLQEKAVESLPTASTSATVNQFGFRTNTQQQQQKLRLRRPWIRTVLPLTTFFWLAVNVGLYLLYWKNKVDSSTVALNRRLLCDHRTEDDNHDDDDDDDEGRGIEDSKSDFGRALSGHTAHFEIWHVGFNMMTLHSLGPTLEHSLGAIPLFLYTASSLPMTTLVIVGLYRLKQVYLSSNNNNNNNNNGNNNLSQFPNMVGFSGILFAWMVVATLNTHNLNRATCPIPFLPRLCFQTYTLSIGGQPVHVNIGPIVQLIILQVVLPRVSFLGHLSGIVVGFLWHWHFSILSRGFWIDIPPLEYLQPCLSWSVLWFCGKYVAAGMYGGENDQSDGSAGSGGSSGYRLGGGAGGGASPWAGRMAGGGVDRTHDSSLSIRAARFLTVTRNAIMWHLAALVLVLTKGRPDFLWPTLCGSIFLSQVMMTAILTMVVQADRKTESATTPFSLGTVGQGYIVLVLVTWITDAMTLAGWIATRVLWQKGGSGGVVDVWWVGLLLLWFCRFLLWTTSLCLVCNLLTTRKNFLSRGIFFQVLGWSVVEPCQILGKRFVDDARWQNHLAWEASAATTTQALDNSTRRRNVTATADNEEGTKVVSDVV